MGNHCCGSSSAVWAAEDEWGPMKQMRPIEREELLGGDDDHDHQAYLSSAEGRTGGQVRIRISKKQLEELLKKVEGSGAQLKKMKVDQALLQRLIEESYHLEFHHHHDHHDHHQRHWKPALQSIPEVN